MYKLNGPKLIFFIPILVIGVLVVAFIPNFFSTSRTLSFSALIIGEAGLSLIPILALYPKALPSQAAVLSVIYFFTTFILCFLASGINSLTGTTEYAFALKGSEFIINVFSLFAANIFSFITLISNFRLVYDEEFAKSHLKKQQQSGYKGKSKFAEFQRRFSGKPTSSQPMSKRNDQFKKKQDKEKDLLDDPFKDDFIKPFEFEPEINISQEDLPEESQGKLLSPEKKDESAYSDFFSDEPKFKDFEKDPDGDFTIKTETVVEPPKTTPSNIFPPSSIKDDLQAIFEQYSSLNAVKKLTAIKSEKIYPRKTIYEKTRNKQSKYKDEPKTTVQTDIHEATYRQVTEDEKLEEIKEKLQSELEERLQAKLSEETQKREQLQSEFEEKFESKLSKEAQKQEEINQRPEEEIIQRIEDVKKELMESLKEELKKGISTPSQDDVSDEEMEYLESIITNINESLKPSGLFFTNEQGEVLLECWNKKMVLHKDEISKATELFSFVTSQLSKTNQGSMLHMLLESENGTLAIADFDKKLLTVHTDGTGEVFSGQILKALSEAEDA